MASGGANLAAAMKKFGTKGTPPGTECNNKDMKKWCEDAGVFTKSNSSQNYDICFSKCKAKGKLNLAVKEVEAVCGEMAKNYMKDKKITEAEAKAEIMTKMAAAEPKGHGTTKQSKTGGVDKMTDSSQYTGAHKSRFGDDGKGKGKAGREDVASNTGYVGAYKGDGSYEKK